MHDAYLFAGLSHANSVVCVVEQPITQIQRAVFD